MFQGPSPVLHGENSSERPRPRPVPGGHELVVCLLQILDPLHAGVVVPAPAAALLADDPSVLSNWISVRAKVVSSYCRKKTEIFLMSFLLVSSFPGVPSLQTRSGSPSWRTMSRSFFFPRTGRIKDRRERDNIIMKKIGLGGPISQS